MTCPFVNIRQSSQCLLSSVFALFLVLLGGQAFATTPYSFHHIGSDAGLPQVTVRALLREPSGRLWIGTEDGLVRLDGQRLRVFKKSLHDTASLADNYIACLAQTPDNGVWVGTLGGGLSRVAPDGERIERIAEERLSNSDVRAIVPDEFGLWLGTNLGLQYLHFDSKHIDEIPLLYKNQPFHHRVKGIARSEDILWVATQGQGLARFDIKTKTVRWFDKGDVGLTDNTFNTIMSDSTGRVFAGSEHAGLIAIHDENGSVTFNQIDPTSHGLADTDVMAIADAGDGRLWVGTFNGGLQLLDLGQGVLASYQHSRANPTSLASNAVTVIAAGTGPYVFVGTYDNGLSFFSKDQVFKTFRYDPLQPADRSLPSPMIWSFVEDDQDTLWIGTKRGLAHLDLKNDTFLHSPTNELWTTLLKHADVRALARQNQFLWCAVRHTGLVRLDPQSQSIASWQTLYPTAQPPKNDDIRLLVMDDRARGIWAGTSEGLYFYDIETGNIIRYQHDPNTPSSLPHNRIRGLYLDSHHQLWVGTSNGLARLRTDGSGFDVWKHDPTSPQTSLAGEGVRAIAEDKAGRLWLGTEAGISIMNPETGIERNVREDDGLSSNSIYGIIADENFIWASTIRGLVRIDPNDLSIFNYFKRDGLPDNEFNFNAWGRLSGQQLVFGGVNGFVVFQPRNVPSPQNPTTPPSLFIQVVTAETSLTYGSSPPMLSLPWQKPAIEFQCEALTFEPPDNIFYQYRLHGKNTPWRTTPNGHVAFTDLAPGQYTFEIKAQQCHGQWATPERTVAFNVATPPWKTWQAYAGYALFLILCTAGALWLSQYRQRQRLAWLEDEVTRRSAELADTNRQLTDQNQRLDQQKAERERLFWSLAHDLRTPLTVIVNALEGRCDPSCQKLRRSPDQSHQHAP
ncbi:two-component regulator propeller domain-containing protein [Desulfovibrio inopinatus]|uniref:two-component regulator propeller domain-containing protein n=1 Tax=Desulfovibrio inopinatus TaxID=102109 RepID=UPI00146F9A0E|nr:two-component regulator propeller domain-containing protein [Desulfovibrio inopinatus]